MKLWKIYLKLSNDFKFENALELYDAKSYFGGYLKIKRNFFIELIKAIKTSNKYLSLKAIEKVISPEDDQDWTNNPWILIISKDIEKSKSFWLLIKREKDLSGILVAIGPKPFADYNNKQDNSEARHEIKQIISYLTLYINKFQSIIFLPNYLQ